MVLMNIFIIVCHKYIVLFIENMNFYVILEIELFENINKIISI